jgi:hypothetical protein
MKNAAIILFAQEVLPNQSRAGCLSRLLRVLEAADLSPVFVYSEHGRVWDGFELPFVPLGLGPTTRGVLANSVSPLLETGSNLMLIHDLLPSLRTAFLRRMLQHHLDTGSDVTFAAASEKVDPQLSHSIACISGNFLEAIASAQSPGQYIDLSVPALLSVSASQSKKTATIAAHPCAFPSVSGAENVAPKESSFGYVPKCESETTVDCRAVRYYSFPTTDCATGGGEL